MLEKYKIYYQNRTSLERIFYHKRTRPVKFITWTLFFLTRPISSKGDWSRAKPEVCDHTNTTEIDEKEGIRQRGDSKKFGNYLD